MNGYEIEHNLELRLRNWSLSPIAQLLYLKLKIIANEQGLITQKFKVSNSELEFRVGISKGTLNTARTDLIKSGILGYKTGGKDGCKKTFGEYWFIDLRNLWYNYYTTNNTTNNTTTDTTTDTTTLPLLKTKTKTKLNLNPYNPLENFPENSEIENQEKNHSAKIPEKTPPQVAPPPPKKQTEKAEAKGAAANSKNSEVETSLKYPSGFGELWQEWLEYRKAKKKKPYAGKKWEQIALNKFAEISKNDQKLGRLILNQTIENNWEGLFELKNNFNQKTETNGTKFKPNFAPAERR